MRKIPFKRHLDRLRQWFSPSRREPVTLEQALPWLVPKVRPRFHYEALALRTGRAWPEFRPLAGLFAVSLAVDTPTGELDVGPEDLARWNADFDRLMQKARSNLLARGGEEGFLKLGPGRFRSSWQDNLDGSRMLLPGILRRLPLAGDPVVVLPSRDTLLVVGSEDPAALRWALDGAAALLDADPGSLNGCPLRFRNLQWEPFQPAGEDPLNPLLQRLGSRRLQEEYRQPESLAGPAPRLGRQGHHRDPVPGGTGFGRDRPQLHRLVPDHGRSVAAPGRPGAPVLGMGAGAGPGLGALGAAAGPPGRGAGTGGTVPRALPVPGAARPAPAGKPPGLTHAGSCFGFVNVGALPPTLAARRQGGPPSILAMPQGMQVLTSLRVRLISKSTETGTGWRSIS